MMARARISPCVLTIAGSDSGGNAGVQADLRTFHGYGLHGCTVFAALTAQNPREVRSVLPVPPEFIADQLDVVFEMYAVKALKTGMLSTPEAIEVVADRLRRHPRVRKVVDPVMVATSGAKLISDEARRALERKLLPLATVITPNLPEAETLLGRAIGADSAAMAAAARELSRRFGCAVYLKGGHAVERMAAERGGRNVRVAQDVLFDRRGITLYSRPVVSNPVSTHGTGCTLAAALASGLALGWPLKKAAERAKIFVYEAIKLSYYIGCNCGVLGMPKQKVEIKT